MHGIRDVKVVSVGRKRHRCDLWEKRVILLAQPSVTERDHGRGAPWDGTRQSEKIQGGCIWRHVRGIEALTGKWKLGQRLERAGIVGLGCHQCGSIPILQLSDICFHSCQVSLSCSCNWCVTWFISLSVHVILLFSTPRTSSTPTPYTSDFRFTSIPENQSNFNPPATKIANKKMPVQYPWVVVRCYYAEIWVEALMQVSLILPKSTVRFHVKPDPVHQCCAFDLHFNVPVSPSRLPLLVPITFCVVSR